MIRPYRNPDLRFEPHREHRWPEDRTQHPAEWGGSDRPSDFGGKSEKATTRTERHAPRAAESAR